MIIGFIVVAVVIVSSYATVLASTVECTVIDGSDIYEFELMNPTVESIAEKATEYGMPTLQENDYAIEAYGSVIIMRSVTLTVNIDGNTEIEVIAYEGETISKALSDSGIEYTNKDYLSLLTSTQLYEDTYLELNYYTPVTVTYYGEVYEVDLYGGTVANALSEAGLSVGAFDYVSPSILTQVEYGMDIEICENVIIEYDNEYGETAYYNASGMTVYDFVLEYGIEVEGDLLLNLSYDTVLQNGDTLTLRETVETVEIETIPYTTSYTKSSNLGLGTTSVKQTGEDGTKEVVYRTTYVNGEIEETYVVSETVIEEAVSEIVVRGTKVSVTYADDDSVNTFTDMYGNEVEYTSVMVGECTAYTSNGGTTSTGVVAQVGIVAVDPSIIPYGTVMYITSGSVVYGYCIAGDTGGAMRSGNALIDLYYDTTSECYQFGRRDMTVYIIG